MLTTIGPPGLPVIAAAVIALFGRGKVFGMSARTGCGPGAFRTAPTGNGLRPAKDRP